MVVLECVVGSGGEPVSTEVVVVRVWEVDVAGDAGSVGGYVGRVRRGVEDLCGGAAIETVRSVGYRLREDRQ